MNKIFLLLAISSLFTACIPKATVVDQQSTSLTGSTSTTTTPTTPTTDPTAPPTEEYGKIPYYTFQNIIAHGTESSTDVIWSTENSVTPTFSDQSIFRTDATLKIRVIAKPSPGKGTDSLGATCTQFAMNYTKLKLKIGVRAQGSTNYSFVYDFIDLPVYTTSQAISFTPPVTSGNFVIDVFHPRWNWYEENYPSYGDWSNVFAPDCIAFEIQMATDSTYDFN